MPWRKEIRKQKYHEKYLRRKAQGKIKGVSKILDPEEKIKRRKIFSNKRIGDNNPNWRGGKTINRHGYRIENLMLFSSRREHNLCHNKKEK